MVAERVGRPVREIEFSLGPRGGPLTNNSRAMAQPDAGELAGGPGASGRPGLTPPSEPRPEVIDDDEEEMQSPSTPITPPGRNPSVLPGGVVGSPATSPDTSESGAVPTRPELQRQIKQQGKLQQQIKSRIARVTLNMQGSLEEAQA